MTQQSLQEHKRISLHSQVVRNLVTNILVVLVRTVAGIWLTKYLIGSLGVAVYGIVPLVTMLTAYLRPVTQALNTAVGRHLTIDIGSNDIASANRTFNTAFWLSVGVSCALIPFIAALSFFAPSIFNVPEGYERATIWVFGLSIVAYLVVYVQSNFSVSAFVRNRLDIRNVITLSYVVSRIAIIVLAFSLIGPALAHVGTAAFIAALISMVLAVYTWRRLTPKLRIRIADFDRSQLRRVLGTSGWVTVNLVGSLLYLNVELAIVNIFLGAEAGGEYASVLQWSILLRTLAAAMAGVLTPIILKYFAQKDMVTVRRLSISAVKFLGLTVALIAGGLAGFSRSLLDIWLGAKFVHLAPLLILLVSHLCVNLAVMPLFHVQVTLNKVKWPAIVTLALGVVNVVLSIALVKAIPMGAVVALTGALVLTAKNFLFTPLYCARILDIRWTTFYRTLITAILGFLSVAGITGFTASIIVIDSWVELLTLALTVAFGYATVVYLVLLSDDERVLIRRFLPA